MFSLDNNFQLSLDLKYFIYENNETTLCIKEIPENNLTTPVLGLITKNKYRYSKCAFIRSDFLFIDNEIYDIKTGIILDELKPKFRHIPSSYFPQEEMFLVKEWQFYKFHLNSFLIFRLWSFIAFLKVEFQEELLDPQLFLDIYDFVKPAFPIRFWYPIPELFKNSVKNY